MFAAPAEGLRLNLEAEPVAVPGECEGLKVAIHTKVQGLDAESRVLKSTVEIDIHNGETLSYVNFGLKFQQFCKKMFSGIVFKSKYSYESVPHYNICKE